ncbi:MAG: hypothetical protein BRC47_10660 [Cyanobacteria bacterium QS_7_48_42]|nr:MAG: hypothetical protein BRC47_10660 [Cyanobacteria bacterium QS_7_48_42]PSP31149.1 MAG: hypothetical protein BRC57_17505 [Cyanobacteria bacterium QS_8_48_54]
MKPFSCSLFKLLSCTEVKDTTQKQQLVALPLACYENANKLLRISLLNQSGFLSSRIIFIWQS